MSLEPERVERIRKKLNEKAKREPNYRFYTLYDKVCWPETIAKAYAQAKANGGAPGVDGIRFADIEAEGADRWQEELRKQLLEESYQPQAVRRVWLEKPGGGQRPLGIPTIRDRVVQKAVLLFLEPIFEADLEENVYAYRPGRSAHEALGEVLRQLYAGQKHVVDADLTQYFDTIPHRDLLKCVARRVADGKILRLIKLWLKSPVEEEDESGRRKRTGGKSSKQGTPQGGVVSPLLANLYMNRLARHWRETGASERLGTFISYADDFVILCASRVQADQSLAKISQWTSKIGLKLHPEKTRVCFAQREPFSFLGYTFGPTAHWRTGKSILVAEPSAKAQKRFKEKINKLFVRGRPGPWPGLRLTLNRLLTGWANYFSFGHPHKAWQAINRHLLERLHRFLCQRHKVRPHGTRRFGAGEIFGALGVVNIQRPRTRRNANALS